MICRGIFDTFAPKKQQKCAISFAVSVRLFLCNILRAAEQVFVIVYTGGGGSNKNCWRFRVFVKSGSKWGTLYPKACVRFFAHPKHNSLPERNMLGTKFSGGKKKVTRKFQIQLTISNSYGFRYRPRRSCDHNIKMDLEENGGRGVENWYGSGKGQAACNEGSIKCVEFSTSWETVRFTRRILLHDMHSYCSLYN